ncbi:hypothetical protein KXX35_009584, partial [Aspergillus fumigatus]
MVPFATAYAVALLLTNITLGVCVFFCRPCQRHDYDDCYGVKEYDDYYGVKDYDDYYGANDYGEYGMCDGNNDYGKTTRR